MKRLGLPILLVLALAVAVAAAWFALDRNHPQPVPGRSPPRARAVPAFTRIQVDGTADVMLVQGAGPAVRVEASARALPDVRTEVRDGTLMIESSERRRWWSFIFGGGSAHAADHRDLQRISRPSTPRGRSTSARTS